MKKRRELDALIGNRSKREVAADNARVEYDSLSSLSSPTAETYMAPSGNYSNVAAKRVSRNSGRGCGCTVRRMIRICLPACFLSLVAACITACIGIVWMQVQLKTDVEKLRDRIVKLETWQSDQPSALDDMKKTMSDMDQNMLSMKNGENGIESLAEKLAILNQKFEDQVVVPNQSIDKINIQTQDIEKTIEELKSSIHSMKSTVDEMKTSQGLLTASYNKLHDDVEIIKNDVSDTNVKQLASLVTSSKQNTEVDINKINSTLSEIAKNLTTLQQTVTELELHTKPDEIWKGLTPKISVIEQDVTALKKAKSAEEETLQSIAKEIINLQSHLSNVISNFKQKSEDPKHTDGKANMEQKSNQEKPSSVLDVFKDIGRRFDEVDKNQDGKLSKDELTLIYGEVSSNALLKYDLDHDGALSRTEISSLAVTSQTTNPEEKPNR